MASRQVRTETILPAPDLAGDHADGAFSDAPGDAGDGLVVGVVPVEHARREVAAEGHALEPVVGLQFLKSVALPAYPEAPPAEHPGACGHEGNSTRLGATSTERAEAVRASREG